jgi:glycosyltransferase involved in cell wall biosynthesis
VTVRIINWVHAERKINNVRLSVIVPCLNSADTIAIQLEALANQQWSQPWEIIVSENGSTDRTLSIVKQYMQKIPYLRMVDASAQSGAAYARNEGARAAAGNLLAFCDADDEVAPGWVAAIGEALSRYDFVAGRLQAVKLNETWAQSARRCPQQDSLQQYTYPPFLPHAAGCNLGVKKSLHQAIGGFDESMPKLHDTDYCWRIQLAGVKLHFIPEALVHYRYRNTLSGMYHQAFVWGEYNVVLYKKYRSQGMPKLSWKQGIRAWIRLFRNLSQLLGQDSRYKWLWEFAWRLGRVRGSLKQRTFAL